MRNITYKYNVGNFVKFKDHYSSTASCGLFELAGSTARVADCSDFNGPAYKLEGIEDTWFKEGCFARLATAEEIAAYGLEASQVDTLQASVSSCDTESSGELELI